MKWINIKTELPKEIPNWYLQTHSCFGDETSVLVFGYDYINFMPKYRVMFINDVSKAKPEVDGRYILNELIVTHWMNIEKP